MKLSLAEAAAALLVTALPAGTHQNQIGPGRVRWTTHRLAIERAAMRRITRKALGRYVWP